MAEILADSRLDFDKLGQTIAGSFVPRQPPRFARVPVSERPDICVICMQPVRVCCANSIEDEGAPSVAGRR